MTYETLTIDIDSDGIALVTIDLPGQSMNVWNEALIADFKAFVEEFQRRGYHFGQKIRLSCRC